MKKIQILGAGCPKCKKLTENAEIAGKKSGVEFKVEKVTDINKIVSFGVMLTPAIAIDGKVVANGTILSVDQIIEILKSDSQPKNCCCGNC